MPIITVEDFGHPGGWLASNPDECARWYCEQLEEANVLLFRSIPYDLPEAHREFLTSHRQSESRVHKNVSYRPSNDLLRGFSGSSKQDQRFLQEIFRHYSQEVTRFLSIFLSPYAGRWSLDYASFRPMEEEGRDLPLHKRNDLLHVDAFPSRPTAGARILRVFTNIHSTKSRIWNTTDPFELLAGKMAKDAGLSEITNKAAGGQLSRKIVRVLQAAGIRVADRSAYDSFMLRFHNYLKENQEFQEGCEKIRLEFPPNSTWIVFTDAVPHAVLSGQFALEQTYIVPLEALVSPQSAPIRILEALVGVPLAPKQKT